MARYPLNFDYGGGWTYSFGNFYEKLCKFTNNEPYEVKVTAVELYLGTVKGTLINFGDYCVGVGNTIGNWIGIWDADTIDIDRNYFNSGQFDKLYKDRVAISPNDGGTSSGGIKITNAVGTLQYNNRTYPNSSECKYYKYTTFSNTVKIAPHASIYINITGGAFSPNSGVLCIDKYGVNGSTRQSYITVEPVNPNVTLTLKYNYSGAPSDKILSVPINNNTSLGSPSRTGYTFDGWYTASSGGNNVSDPYKVTKNTTLYAHWTVDQYTISYDANGGGDAPNPQSANYASQITLVSNIPIWKGYIFLSWNTLPDGTGISYAPGNTITMPAINITLYAQWMQAPPIWVYSTTDNQWHNAADPSPSHIQNYRPIYRYDEANSQWVSDRNINIYNGGWKEVTSNGGQ